MWKVRRLEGEKEKLNKLTKQRDTYKIGRKFKIRIKEYKEYKDTKHQNTIH